jgi:hypothetical protein
VGTGMGHAGHGLATSTAAKDKSTTGLAHAIGVVSTTPASPHALEALETALASITARSTSSQTDDATSATHRSQ